MSWRLCGCYFDTYQPQHLSFTPPWQQHSLIPVLFFRKYCIVVPRCKNNLPWSPGEILVFCLEFFANIFELELLSPLVFIVYIFVFRYFLITIMISFVLHLVFLSYLLQCEFVFPCLVGVLWVISCLPLLLSTSCILSFSFTSCLSNYFLFLMWFPLCIPVIILDFSLLAVWILCIHLNKNGLLFVYSVFLTCHTCGSSLLHFTQRENIGNWLNRPWV